jgi:heme/copper-type cytochrome/quinol oxidase subunit 2
LREETDRSLLVSLYHKIHLSQQKKQGKRNRLTFITGKMTDSTMNAVSNDTFGMTGNCSLFDPASNSTWSDECPDPGLGGPVMGNFPFLVLEFAKVLYGIVCLVGLCGNSLVIYVVLRFSKMQTVTNMYIFNLALADEMFLIGLPFLIVTVVFKYWPFGSIMCKIYMTTTSVNQFTSSLLLTVMSADRYVAVCHPISSPRYRTPFIAKFICMTAWSVSVLLMVPIFMYANTLTHGNSTHCNIYWPENEIMNGQKAFTLYSFTLGFFIPCVLILLFYFLVICKLRTVGPKNKSKEKKKSHRKVTYLVLTVITVYVLCWLPYWVGQVYITFLPPTHTHTDGSLTFLLLVGCLSYANSAMNPILYAFLSENFKKSFAKAFTCAANKDINNQLNVENSANPRTTRGGSSKFGNALSRQRDRDRIRDHFEENIANSAFDPIGGVSPPERPPSDHDDEDDDEEEDEEVLEIEESPAAIPMTSRFSSYVGSVINRNNIEQGARFTDKQVLLDVAVFDNKDPLVRISDPTSL